MAAGLDLLYNIWHHGTCYVKDLRDPGKISGDHISNLPYDTNIDGNNFNNNRSYHYVVDDDECYIHDNYDD